MLNRVLLDILNLLNPGAVLLICRAGGRYNLPNLWICKICKVYQPCAEQSRHQGHLTTAVIKIKLNSALIFNFEHPGGKRSWFV